MNSIINEKHSFGTKFFKVAMIVILCIIVAFVLICFFFILNAVVYYFTTNDIYTFVITPELSVDLMSTYPDELDDAYAEFFDEWNVEYETIDGNLVLYVQERKLEPIIDVFMQFTDHAAEKGVVISSDYKRIEFDANNPIEKDGFYSPWAVVECAWIQLFSGVPAEDIKVEVVAIDYSIDEVVYQATWPNYIAYTYTTDEVKITHFIEDGVAYYREIPIK